SPILVNTLFNGRGEPLVCTPQDAVRGCMTTEMDVQVLEAWVVLKAENESTVSGAERQRHLAKFELD
ncbi:MAG: carbamoyltransferase C-terminal domain-containing protein, partial [Planctomyces sp.]